MKFTQIPFHLVLFLLPSFAMALYGSTSSPGSPGSPGSLGTPDMVTGGSANKQDLTIIDEGGSLKAIPTSQIPRLAPRGETQVPPPARPVPLNATGTSSTATAPTAPTNTRTAAPGTSAGGRSPGNGVQTPGTVTPSNLPPENPPMPPPPEGSAAQMPPGVPTTTSPAPNPVP